MCIDLGSVDVVFSLLYLLWNGLNKNILLDYMYGIIFGYCSFVFRGLVWVGLLLDNCFGYFINKFIFKGVI